VHESAAFFPGFFVDPSSILLSFLEIFLYLYLLVEYGLILGIGLFFHKNVMILVSHLLLKVESVSSKLPSSSNLIFLKILYLQLKLVKIFLLLAFILKFNMAIIYKWESLL
jgi:hypothetical protein